MSIEYGVFIRYGTEWKWLASYASHAEAQRELDYVTGMLGLQAAIFQRPVSTRLDEKLTVG